MKTIAKIIALVAVASLPFTAFADDAAKAPPAEKKPADAKAEKKDAPKDAKKAEEKKDAAKPAEAPAKK